MKTLGAAALATGLLTASCAGNGLNSAGPPLGSLQNGAPALGAQQTRVSAAVAAPAGWAATATQGLKIKNAADGGSAPASQSITVHVGLQLQNVSQLKSGVASGQVIDSGTFLSKYAPTTAQAAAVTSYLQSKGFTNVTTEPDHLIVSGTGTIAQAQSAFNTSIHSFSGGGFGFIANISPAYVPQSLAGTVVAVVGLNNMQAFGTKTQVTNCSIFGVATPPQACLRWYDPSTFQVAYHAGTTPTGKNTAVAIMAEGNVTQSISDFRLNEQKDSLPYVPVQVIHVGLQSTDTAAVGEWTLDMTYSSGIAQALKAIYLYDTTSLTDSDIALEYSKWVTQGYSKIGNSSFGGCEFFPFLDGSMVLDDETLLEGASKGMTMFASSGDNGGFCNNFVDTNGVPGGAPFVMYPAASPYVVAVGGTELYTNANASYKGEDVWPAGGGGLSQFEYSPYWEQPAQPVSSNVVSDRGVPDVAMDAGLGPIGNAIIYSNQQAINGGSCNSGCITGGTSLASPLSAGIYARMQTAHANALGFAAPLLYKDFYEHTAGAILPGPPATRPYGGFHDILQGSNGSYTALPGYDYATGLGSFDISIMNSQIGH